MLFRTGNYTSEKMGCSPTRANLDLKMTVKHYEFGTQNKRPTILSFTSRHSKVPSL